jgi:hypothetical protein
MPDSRVFSQEELRIGSLRSVDALGEALDQGDEEAAKFFGRRLRYEVLSMRQNYDGWEATLLDWVLRRTDPVIADEARDSIDALDNVALPFDSHEDVGDRWRELARKMATSTETGDTSTTRDLAEQLHTEALLYHDRGMTRTTHLLSWIGRRFGIDELEQAYSEAMSADLLGDASFRERAEALMHFTRVHLQPFRLEEDEEKLTFICSVCPSGGRLIQQGAYEGDTAALLLEGPRPLTYGQDALPVYCAHEPIMEKASIEKTGVPLFIVEPSDDLGHKPCKTYLYKEPAQIPDRYYTRLGLKKPKGKA